ncbi:MAG: efflux RND transporter periplasmic adaptor subunit [Holophagales bacterium]|nr:efflux RND transporter periplasmic adaptor subunit [Holophagales bacterium]
MPKPLDSPDATGPSRYAPASPTLRLLAALLPAAISISCGDLAGGSPAGSSPGLEHSDQTSSTVRRAPPARVTALGRLEPGEGVIDVGAPRGDRVAELEAGVLEVVEEGQPLALLDSRDERRAEREVRAARLAEAEAALERTRAVGAAAVEAARADVRRLEEELVLASSDRRRSEALTSEGVWPARELEAGKTAEARARETLEHARAVLEQRRRSLRTEEAEARARLVTARSELAAAEARLERTLIRAPVSGTVLQIFTWPGESTDSGPLLRMGETGNMYAVAEVYQTDARWIEPGQRTIVTSPALPPSESGGAAGALGDMGVLEGTVERVGRSIHKNDVLGVDPSADRDARVVEVRITLHSPEVAARFVHLQVDVTLYTSDPAGGSS